MAALRGQGAENTHTAFTIPNRTRGTFKNPGRGTGQAGSTVKQTRDDRHARAVKAHRTEKWQLME